MEFTTPNSAWFLKGIRDAAESLSTYRRWGKNFTAHRVRSNQGSLVSDL